MTGTAPITQDVMTIPRKLPEGPKNLVGLTREQMREALIEIGTPEKQAKMSGRSGSGFTCGANAILPR
jgi:23S rRNA (adenine2503-C2)-methyltransferase